MGCCNIGYKLTFYSFQLWLCCSVYHIGIYIPPGYVKISIENGPFSSWIDPLKMVIFHSYGTVYQRVSLFINLHHHPAIFPASLDGHGNPKLSAQWLEPKTCKNVLSLKIKKINKLKPLTYTTPHNHILPWCISGITIGYIMHIYIYTHTYVYIYIQYICPVPMTNIDLGLGTQTKGSWPPWNSSGPLGPWLGRGSKNEVPLHPA